MTSATSVPLKIYERSQNANRRATRVFSKKNGLGVIFAFYGDKLSVILDSTGNKTADTWYRKKGDVFVSYSDDTDKLFFMK